MPSKESGGDMSEEKDDLSVEGIAKKVLKKLGVTHYNLAQYQTQQSVVIDAIKSLSQRLSQAEAELKLQEKAWNTLADSNSALKARLSHLMDVAGKLSHALFIIGETSADDISCMEAKKANAEWDGIKEKK